MDAQPNASPDVTPDCAQRMFEALVGGIGIETISVLENLPVARVESILREEISRRWVAPVADFAKIQIARLESLTLPVLDRAQSGNLPAIDRALKIFDRLDRYHGFKSANPVVHRYTEEDRRKLLDKLNAMAARLNTDKCEE
ncbi:MAG TPA: hypothetical protein VMI72_03150 [Roseiarcus sp.]|nr:hypothetical protein [Roseiarcus sp.]